MTSSSTHDLENVLEDLESAAEQCDGPLSVGEALDAFAHRSFGALLTVIALVAALPLIGAIPGVSILTGALVILVAVQFLFGRDTPWTPKWLREISIDAETVRAGADKAKPYAARVDSVIRPRLTQITKGAWARTSIAVLSILLALLFFPAALVPFGVWVPALSVMALGLALLANDGLLALIGVIGGVGSLALVIYAI